MADDPNRDILPVKDDSCYGSVRCSSEIDPRERHIVCKLDRYQLEDRYLRLLEEVQGLKKLSNSQEDKIKKLATKLMRSAATSRPCTAILSINDDRERITRLELENARLKDKAYTLKNQLLSHRGPRSPSRCRRVASGISSGPTTYRSESARTKYQPQQRDVVEDNDTQNYLVKIEELETQRNGMMTRIAELESQISVHVAGIQREKVQDNVEYIRMWRQMKQANDKLVSVQAANDTLHGQIADLKKLLEDTTKNNHEVTAALVTEKQRLSEMDDQITSAKDSQLSLREKDEQIRDLTNEMKILQQHNNELIALSSKFGQVEVENIELKRKVSEYAQDHQTLKSAFNAEQADHSALRAANDKLIKKVEELQRNMDNLTMQLTTFQSQGERRFVSTGTQTEKVKHIDKRTGTPHVSKNYSISSEEEKESFSDEKKLRFADVKSDQIKRSELATNTRTEAKFRLGAHEGVQPISVKHSRPISGKTKHTHQATSPSMSREKILMLLDQAQISTPLEAQNAARMRQIDVAVGQNDGSIFPESYRIPITNLRRRSNDGFISDEISSIGENDDDQSREQIESCDPKKILLTLFEILKNYSEKIHENIDSSCACRDLESGSTEIIDYSDSCYSNCRSIAENLNIVTNFGRDNGRNKPRANSYEKLKNDIDKTKTMKEQSIKDRSSPLKKFTETLCCTCDSNHRCLANSDCGYGCCTPETGHGLSVFNRINSPFPNKPPITMSGVGEIGSSIQEVFDSIYTGRDCSYDCNAECYDHQNEIKPLITSGKLKIDHSSKVMSRALYNSESGHKKEKTDSNCETDCRTATECGDIPAFCEISAFPLLITKGQGLVEIHIQALQLSGKATQTLFKNDSIDISVFISWDVWGQERAFTPILKYPLLTFNSSSVYRVSELQNFFENVLREHIVFQVHVVDPDEETFTVAKAKLSVKDILDYPQNKLHYITPVFSVIPCSCDGNFGQLSLWIRLSCDIDLVENFKHRCGLASAVSKDQKVHIPVKKVKEERESFPDSKKGSSSINSTSTSSNLYSIPELTTLPVRDVIPEVPERQKTYLGHLQKVQSNRLDTIRESEPEYPVESEEELVQEGKDRHEDAVQVWSDIVQNTSTTSIVTVDNDSHDSDDGNRGTSEDTISQDLQKTVDNGEQIESGSITEFNNVLKNQNDGSPLHGTESAIDDLGKVIADDKWEEYKRDSNSNSNRPSISSPRKSDDSNFEDIQDGVPSKNVVRYCFPITIKPPGKDTITISIVAMNLFEKTSVMNSPDVELLYVEYSFLGIRGADMETVSLHKPKNKGESLVYNFTRKFEVDEENHMSQRNMLIAMLSGTANPNIRFVIVSEPLPEEVDTDECVEVGHADLNIREYALGDGLRDVPLIVMNPSQSEQFGMLKITIDGIEVIRNCMTVQKRF